jgi:hypothetical protein
VRALLLVAAAVAGCLNEPPPSTSPTEPIGNSCPIPRPGGVVSSGCPTFTATASPVEPSPSPIVFNFDVENDSSVGVVVSVVSDVAAWLPGFEPGERGTVSIELGTPRNGIGIEIQDGKCGLLASGHYPTPTPFTLIIADGTKPGVVQLSTRAGAAASPMPLPSNPLAGCGG